MLSRAHQAIKIREVSCSTALFCLRYLSNSPVIGVDNQSSTSAILAEQKIPVDRLVAIAESSFRVRQRKLDWPALKALAPTEKALLLLRNGNVIAVIGAGRPGNAEVVGSDPLYQSGKLFFLPQHALIRMWDGDTLVLEPRRSTAAAILNIYILTLSIFGIIAAGFILVSAARLDEARVLKLRMAGIIERMVDLPEAESKLSEPQRFGGIPTEHELSALGFGPVVLSKRTTMNLPSVAESLVKALANENGAGPSSSEQAVSAPLHSLTPEHQQAAARINEWVSDSAIASLGTPAVGRLAPSDFKTLIARGDAMMVNGDLASARLFYERAANAHDGSAALRLGETFDPAFLKSIRGARGDAGLAAHWYRWAIEFGVPEAEILLNGLAIDAGSRRR
jgi:hypothetical protein